MLHLYNSLSRQIEPFVPMSPPQVNMYTCGPTVYDYVHIGNLRTYVFEDVLRRVLKYNGYQVTHVMNITDVGHLTDDANDGEDKMEKGAKREGKTAWDIAAFYTQSFQDNLRDLHILEPHIWCKATDHIPEQINQVQALIDKGYTYETSDGIYFDTTKLVDYGALAQLDKQALKAGARVEMGEKRHPHDFALWKFTKPHEKRQMEWTAFGRQGFPGWHIECSAMSMKYLGDQFDIHCGGVDHIPVHHTNEIAQAEAITNKKPWVKYWLHGEFLVINGGRMGKSEGNFITLQTLKDKDFHPLAYRYFLLQTHYRKQLHFTWEALKAAAEGWNNLRRHVNDIPPHAVTDPSIKNSFFEAINDDLNIPQALSLVWAGVKQHTLDLDTIIQFDKILGLHLHDPQIRNLKIPDIVQQLLRDRDAAREMKDWTKSDALRHEIATHGFTVEDTPDGQKVRREETP